MDSQPATQPVLDPRRLGRNNSGLSESDLSDVLVILHPTTSAAFKIVEAVARVAPQHILQNEDLLEGSDDGALPAGDGDAEMDLAPTHPLDAVSAAAGAGRDSGLGDVDVVADAHHAQTVPLAAGAALSPETAERPSRDIALRLSSDVRDLGLGFVFGRMAHRCDVQLCADEGNRFVSQQQFRIYVNSQGSLMLQDLSTNGSWIDRFLLRTKPVPGAPEGQRGEWGSQRMLQTGATIAVLCGKSDVIRFVVRIPSRLNHEDAFQATLEDYLDRVAAAQHLRANPPQLPATVSDGPRELHCADSPGRCAVPGRPDAAAEPGSRHAAAPLVAEPVPAAPGLGRRPRLQRHRHRRQGRLCHRLEDCHQA